jgi:hypothetical protein
VQVNYQPDKTIGAMLMFNNTLKAEEDPGKEKHTTPLSLRITIFIGCITLFGLLNVGILPFFIYSRPK